MKKTVALLLAVLATLFLFGSCGSNETSKTIRISFDTDGKVRVSSVKINVGEIPEMPEEPAVEGYVFAGWYTDDAFENRYFFDYAFEKNATLYAKFYDVSLGEYTVISNVEQLLAAKDAPEAKYILACDINCGGETLEPIAEFAGEFEGNCHEIFNFAITVDADNVAFIGTNNGTVKNLTLRDYIYDVTFNGKNYGLVCAVNNGTVQNCHVFEGEMKITVPNSKDLGSVAIGGVVGQNNGNVEKCTSKANVNANVSITSTGGTWIYPISHSASAFIGGVVGHFNTGRIGECVNYGDVELKATNYNSSYSNGSIYSYVGGVAGYVKAVEALLEESANLGSLNVNAEDHGSISSTTIGGLCATNLGIVKNCYAECDINSTTVTGDRMDKIGGLIGHNTGKIYNCYSNVNVVAKGNPINILGGFIGYNELLSNKDALVSKCFAMGSVTVEQVPVNYGYFAGKNTGDIATGIYSDGLTIKLSAGETLTDLVEPTCTNGEAKAESEILSVDFIENTLYFDRMIWLLEEGKLPTLR